MINFEIELCKINIGNCAQKFELEELDRGSEKYALKYVVEDLKSELNEKVKQEELQMVIKDLEDTKKSLGRMSTRDEMVVRLNVIASEYNNKIDNRPTLEKVN